MNKLHLVIGSKGEVGSALVNLLSKKYTVFESDINIYTNTQHHDIDFIHICIPYSDSFINEVVSYRFLYGQENCVVVIHSTVYPGTTFKLSKKIENVVYSPIRGKHPNIYNDLLFWTKYFASQNKFALFSTLGEFLRLEIKIKGYLEDPTSLEFAKHFSTLMYGASLVFSQELAMLSKKLKFNPKPVMEFVNDTGDLTKDRKIYPFIEDIGGHCVKQNAIMIADLTNLARTFIESNDRFVDMFGKERIYFWKEEERK